MKTLSIKFVGTLAVVFTVLALVFTSCQEVEAPQPVDLDVLGAEFMNDELQKKITAQEAVVDNITKEALAAANVSIVQLRDLYVQEDEEALEAIFGNTNLAAEHDKLVAMAQELQAKYPELYEALECEDCDQIADPSTLTEAEKAELFTELEPGNEQIDVRWCWSWKYGVCKTAQYAAYFGCRAVFTRIGLSYTGRWVCRMGSSYIGRYCKRKFC